MSFAINNFEIQVPIWICDSDPCNNVLIIVKNQIPIIIDNKRWIDSNIIERQKNSSDESYVLSRY